MEDPATEPKPDWYERCYGHWWLDHDDLCVHICARGSNLGAPVAIVERSVHSVLLWLRCKTFEEAQRCCEETIQSIQNGKRIVNSEEFLDWRGDLNIKPVFEATP